MSRLETSSRFAPWVVLGLLLFWLGVPWSRAAAPAGDDVLRDKGLTRVGQVYLLGIEDDIKERIAAIRRLIAEYVQGKARLTEDLSVLGRSERRYQDLLQRQQAVEAEWQEYAKQMDGPPPSGGFGGPGSQDGFGGPPPPPPVNLGGPPRPGPPPPQDREKGRDPFGPRGKKAIQPRMVCEELARQYEKLQADRTTLETKMTQGHLTLDDLAARLEARIGEVERRSAEVVRRYEQVKGRYAALAGESDVIRALAAVNETSNPKVTLGPREEDFRDLHALANELRGAGAGMPDRQVRLELQGIARLTGLAGAAEAFQQELGVASRRLQELERDAESRKRMIDHAASEQKTVQVEKLRTEQAHVRQTIREAFTHLATAQDSFLRGVAALHAALDAPNANSRPDEPAGDSRTRGEILKLALGEKAAAILSTENVARRLHELEKTIRTEKIVVDSDKTILWVDATLNGKSGYPMIVDPGAADVRLSARVAAEVGVRAVEGAGEPAVEIPLIGGRTSQARRARLESVLLGSFKVSDVECVVLPEAFGEAPSVLGGSFLKRFAARTDADSGTLVLTQVQVKPAGRAAKTGASKPASSPKANRPAP
jgi:predicted aspartyl protease